MATVNIRAATAKDVETLYWVAAEMGQSHEMNYFERCVAEQSVGNRIVFVAESDDAIIGYVQLNFTPTYQPFRRLDIPEIQDLNVIPSQRQQGLGALLVDHCEKAAKEMGKSDVGIAVGLYPRYGAAQRLYAKKGYVPDGAGVAYDDMPVQPGEMRPVDDLLTLKLIKPLGG